MPDT